MPWTERGLEGTEPVFDGDAWGTRGSGDATADRPANVVDGAEVLRSVVRDCQAQADGKRLTIAYHPPERPPMLRASPAQLRQVFERLLGHAIAAAPRGGTVTLRARCREAGVFRVEIAEWLPKPGLEERPARRRSGRRFEAMGDNSSPPPGSRVEASAARRLDPDGIPRDRHVHHFDSS